MFIFGEFEFGGWGNIFILNQQNIITITTNIIINFKIFIKLNTHFKAINY